LAGAGFEGRISEVAGQVEAELDRLLSPALLAGEIARPPRLLAAMRHAALGGGKRLRPFLLIESAALFEEAGAGVLRAACALEMVHCYSLVHDDLPAMDDDDLRRGRPTVHKAFDEATAILVGDSLLTYAFDVLGDEATHADARIRASLVTSLARAAGPGGMAGGQMLDLEAEAAAAPLTRDAIETLQAMKTGALIRYAAEAGAIIGGASASERGSLVQYGRMLGAAFQIADDILDAEGDADKLGKAAAKDAARNKGTLVSLLGMASAKQLRDECAARACEALAGFGARAEILRQTARFTVIRDH
jgi:farnesyl diphosphate synthase